MQLDKTLIAVRERRITESLDLSLHVFRVYAIPLLLTMGLGAVPLALFNHFLTIGMLGGFGEEFMPDYMAGSISRYFWTNTVLVVMEAPLAAVFATAYLGQAVFLEKPRIRRIVRDVIALGPRVTWCHLMLRGVLPAWLLASLIDTNEEYSQVEFWLMLLFMVICLRRATSPFLNEIVLLERNPLLPSAYNKMTVRRRSVMLHRPNGGELLYRWTVSAFYGGLLTASCFATLICLQGMFFDQWTLTLTTLSIFTPLSMWSAALFLTVVRFLSYLDVRIRQEGWEVELRLRAEGARLVESVS